MIYLALFLLIFTLLSLLYFTARTGISPMPSSYKTKKKLLTLLKKREKVSLYELGAAWGTLAIPLSKNHHVTAFELSWIPWFISLLRAKLMRAPLILKRADFFKSSLEKADIIFCYLYPNAMERLEEKFDKELPKEAYVFSNSFSLPNWKPYAVYTIDDWYQTKLYCYKKSDQFAKEMLLS